MFERGAAWQTFFQKIGDVRGAPNDDVEERLVRVINRLQTEAVNQTQQLGYIWHNIHGSPGISIQGQVG